MAMLELEAYSEKEFNRWNAFVDEAVNGTVFHKLDFLAYHKDKFSDNAHHLLYRKGDKIAAVLPLGIFKQGDKLVAKSPFGASWGGLVHGRNFSLKDAMQVVEQLKMYLKEKGVNELLITPTPQPYYQPYSAFFEFALISSGFTLCNRDVIHVVDLHEEEDVWKILDTKCRNQVRKGQQLFEIASGAQADEFYPVLQEDKQRLNAPITHTLEELQYLKSNFGNVFFDMAYNLADGGKAGVGYFKGNKHTVLTFYLAQNNAARGKNGLNALILEGMLRAKQEGIRFFDFGTSSSGGVIGNIGISEFKESFGAKGYFRDTYRLEIK